ncbi:DUF5060 domain-containing protein [Paraglaciecola aquimarina]|uniref:DUF5060 domain-containing protein n=1 Tax=Paraglaciecola aquimarina TaxID=1235557 RepID=A0ABU3SYK8_9ALTE|nr:DUF5060 domain-containing protein [Paraglaciecola aquimarina]MDU0355002.1 DUF5060 domain-containing protein [Paraglaciecola aquimarina]
MKRLLVSCTQALLLTLLSNSGIAQQSKAVIDANVLMLEGSGFYKREGMIGFRVEDGKTRGEVTSTVPMGNGRFDISLHTAGDKNGQSTYTVKVGDSVIGKFIAPKTEQNIDTSSSFVAHFKRVEVNEGEKFSVIVENASHNGKDFSRGLWSKLVFSAIDYDPSKAKSNVSALRLQEEIEAGPALVTPRQQDGDGAVVISGEQKQWHDVVLTMDGPFAYEQDVEPNPFLDYRMSVTFAHESGVPTYTVPGYFATDGNAAESSAESGIKWRAHLSPDKAGLWSYRISFVKGENASVTPSVGEYVYPYQGKYGTFKVAKTDKKGKDFRAKGRLEYVGGHYLRHAGSGEYFLKAGPDAPETMLAYADIDNTFGVKPNLAIKTWQPHAQDAKSGDPTWQGGKGKNLLGAFNYLASKGLNAFSFLTYNAAGDGDNIWPYVERNGKFHFDTSKLDQWGRLFSHAQELGLYLHFKLQENESDDNRKGKGVTLIKESLDGGLLGIERKLYLRELIARYAHHLALNWNIGEENTQSYEEQRDMAEYILNLDPYDHHTVIHSFPNQQEKVYLSLLGPQSVLTGASLQNSWKYAHQKTLLWVEQSRAAGKPWVVANDEQNPAGMGVPPDPGYKGFDGWAEDREMKYNLHDIRKKTLWGNLMAGGAGVEYYFGYRLLENDLVAEDFRSRDKSWDYAGIAVKFFAEHDIPFHRMRNMDQLASVTDKANQPYVFANEGEVYLVYLHAAHSTTLDLSLDKGTFGVKWFNPRTGGMMEKGTVDSVTAGGMVDLGQPKTERKEDWLAVLRKD